MITTFATTLPRNIKTFHIKTIPKIQNENCSKLKTVTSIEQGSMTLPFGLLYWQKQPPDVFYKKNYSQKLRKNSQENTCARASFLIKVQAEACNFIKKDWHRCFPVNFAKKI